MLKQLYIKNFTLIDELDIPFYPGFSVITGETGAGKSIILGAIGLLLGNRADAEDATQETFLKVWRNIGRFEARNGCSPKTWIIRIAGNTCRDYLRRGWKKHESRQITPEDLNALGSAPHEDRELIMDVMNLPDEYRQAVLLVFWYGMTIRETAECMCTSAATVSRRLEKARRMIA